MGDLPRHGVHHMLQSFANMSNGEPCDAGIQEYGVEIRTSFTFSLYEHLFTFIYFLLYPTIDSSLAPYYLDYSLIMVSSSYSKLRLYII